MADNLTWRLEKPRFVQIAHLWYCGQKERPSVPKTLHLYRRCWKVICCRHAEGRKQCTGVVGYAVKLSRSKNICMSCSYHRKWWHLGVYLISLQKLDVFCFGDATAVSHGMCIFLLLFILLQPLLLMLWVERLVSFLFYFSHCIFHDVGLPSP